MATPVSDQWKVEVNTHGDPPGTWSGNALRFATWEEANDYGMGLAARWLAVSQYRVIRCDVERIETH